MKEQLYKLLTCVPAALLVYLIWMPPEWFAELGLARYLLEALLLGVALVGVVAILILGSLPAHLELAPLAGEPGDAKLQRVAQKFRDLGFQPIGSWTVQITPAATLMAFVHPGEPIYGSAFRTGTEPPKVAFDLVSLLPQGLGGLTTSPEPSGATLPGSPGSFRQSFAGAELERLIEEHRKAIEFLGRKGIRPRALTAERFLEDFKASMARQRQAFLAAPLLGTIRALWCNATGKFPNQGSLEGQPGVERQVERVLAGV